MASKRDPKSCLGVYLDDSPCHAGSVALVLHPRTLHVSPHPNYMSLLMMNLRPSHICHCKKRNLITHDNLESLSQFSTLFFLLHVLSQLLLHVLTTKNDQEMKMFHFHFSKHTKMNSVINDYTYFHPNHTPIFLTL